MSIERQPPTDPLDIVVTYLEKSGKDELAEKVIDAFAEGSHNLEQLNMIAKLYFDIRSIKKAEEYALRVLTRTGTQEQIYNARANLAKMYNNINEPEKSLFYTKLNQLIEPDDPDAKLETVFSLYLLGQKKEAEVILREMEKNADKLSERHRDIVNFNLGTYNLEQGRFQEGLKGFLLNVKKLELWFSPRELPYKFWDGGIFPGRTLIMFMEGGGIGDEFITIRFWEDLKKVGFDPVYYTSRHDLARLFNANGFEAVTTLDGLPADSLWTYAMQVPIWLEMNEKQVMRNNYLKPTEEARKKWAWVKEKYEGSITIGVRWQGNSKNERDLHRQVPIDDLMFNLRNAMQGKNVKFISLQIGDAQEETARHSDLIDISDGIKSFDDTLALMENLDYVVTSCTSVLHGSAIVGTKTLALIPISAYFTWVSPAEDHKSIWYGDHLRLFRQVKSKNWDQPMSELCHYLLSDIGA